MKSASLLLLSFLVLAGCNNQPDESHPVTTKGPVSAHGLLHVKGNKIVGVDARPVSLAGVSFGWSQWEARPYYNASVVNWLKDDWNCDIVRAALGIKPDGYLGNPDAAEFPSWPPTLPQKCCDWPKENAIGRLDREFNLALQN